MNILAHRGQWSSKAEQNTLSAFEKAFQNGYGIETDLRDLEGDIVISHNMPVKSNLPTLNELLLLYIKYGMETSLALNVKADGLQQRCKLELESLNIDLKNVFFFDMSIPDGLQYLKQDLPCFTRYSDEEIHPSFLDRACGVWLDGFQSDCTDEAVIMQFLEAKLNVCFVSPELHQRQHLNVWSKWRSLFDKHEKSGMVCTDFPDEADMFFNG